MTNLNSFLEGFSHFSTENWKSSLDMASMVLNNTTISSLHSILTVLKEHLPRKGRLLYKFMKSAILDLINEIKMQSQHPESKLLQIKELLFSAFQYFYKTWQAQDEIRKQKKEEEEKLYKTVHHEGELSDEEKMDKALKEMFPSYEKVIIYIYFFFKNLKQNFGGFKLCFFMSSFCLISNDAMIF